MKDIIKVDIAGLANEGTKTDMIYTTDCILQDALTYMSEE